MREVKVAKKKDNENSSKIIAFPRINKRLFEALTTEKELEEKVIKNKIKFADKTSSELVEDMFFKMSMMGITFEEDMYEKDIILVTESVKSIMLKNMGIQHDLQTVAEELIVVDEIVIDED